MGENDTKSSNYIINLMIKYLIICVAAINYKCFKSFKKYI